MSTVLITGAGRGIGLQLTLQLAARGDTVLACCRRPTAQLERAGVRIVDGVDVTETEGLARLVHAVGELPLDVLINNSGILSSESLRELDIDSIRRQFEVNALGPLRVTHALLGNLGEGGKVAIITSRMGSIADNTSGGRYGYRMSKAAVNIAGVSLAHDLRSRGISVALLHPGFVATDMTGGMGNYGPNEAAQLLIQRIDDMSPTNSGTFWHASGEVLPW
jgi:NAD(P)-dependent dehydrogenase (short-subunit alcohol dehydrogenase family)